MQVQNTGNSTNMIIEADSWTAGWSVTPKNVNPNISSGSSHTASFTVTPPITGGSGTIVWKFYDDGFGVHPSGSTLLATSNQSVTATAAPAVLSVSPSSFTKTITEGQNASSDTFTVSNTGGVTLNYTISDGGTSWLSQTPTSGSVVPGGAATITVNYATSGLAAASYPGTITISAAGATGSPKTVGVNLIVNSPPFTPYFSNARIVNRVDQDARAIASKLQRKN